MTKIRISSRRSDLARLQAYQVGKALMQANGDLEVEYFFKESLGDKNLNDPLWKMPERGVFTEDFVSDLLEERTDLVVHSWKDLPTEPRANLEIAATLPRADARDLLLLRKNCLGKETLELLTSSPRRAFASGAVLAPLLPFKVKEIRTKPVRGNIFTRLKKLSDGEGDGLFLAKAALDRLLTTNGFPEDFSEARAEIRELLKEFCWMVLPLSLFPSAPAQGALAIEIRSDRKDLKKLLASIHHEETSECVQEERRRFSAFGGGCHQKIGITVQKHPRLGRVEFFHGQPDGQDPSRTITVCPVPARPEGSIWPEGSRPVFQRKILSDIRNPGGNLFISRANALPENWSISAEQLVWAAGVHTWKKLAQRGIWVNGCCDGLGESVPETRALCENENGWTKLTHEGSCNDLIFPCLATYRLDAIGASAPPMVKSYFWVSESLFRWAIEKRPEIRFAKHASGPGYTAYAIEKELGHSIDVFYNHAQWRTGNAIDET